MQKITKRTVVEEATPEKPAKKSKTTAPPPTEEPEEAAGSESEGEEQEDEEEVQILASKLDPEDEDAPEDTVYKTGQPVGTIPDVAQAVEKAAKKSTGSGEPGVIYIGRIPHGFYEHEMRNYFSQFGHIKKLILSRNKKTGASKHFAFIEFAEASTADIVAKTMDNYLLFGHILKCHVVPPAQVHEHLFKGANKRFKKIPWNKLAGLQLQKPLSEAKWEKRVSQEKTKRAKKMAKLQEIGYEFEAPGIKQIPPPAVIEQAEEATKAIEAAPETDAAVPEPTEESEPKVKSISAPKTKPTKGRGKRAKA